MLKKFILSNYYLQLISFKLIRIYLILTTDTIIGHKAKIGLSSKLGGKNSFGEDSKFIGSKIGYASYLSNNSSLQNTKIGKYSSIGPNVKTIHGTHPTEKFVSTHPAFFSIDKQVGFSYTEIQLFKEKPDKISPNEPYTTEIGNDVWIGASVNIVEGIKIGNGAIIASGALVNKNVPPYSIVGGVPSKIIRYRFEDSEIDFLLKFKWWNQSKEWIEKNAEFFIDIKQFLHVQQSKK